MKLPLKQLRGLKAVIGEHGIYQHWENGEPAENAHAHSSDDQARLLQVAIRYMKHFKEKWFTRLPELTMDFASKVQRSDGLSNNYMDDKGNIITGEPGELYDVFGRWMCAFAELANSGHKLNKKAGEIFNERLKVIPRIIEQESTHAHSYSLLALSKRIKNSEKLPTTEISLAIKLAGKILEKYKENTKVGDGWNWPENKLDYCLGKIPESLISTRRSLGVKDYAKSGLEMLDFLVKESFQDGVFWPPGNSNGFYQRGKEKPEYCQQTCEAILAEALVEAFECTKNTDYINRRTDIIQWFELGKNSRNAVLLSPEGGVYDAVTEHDEEGASKHQGAESRLTYLLVKSTDL